jgi:hypothetical protein
MSGNPEAFGRMPDRRERLVSATEFDMLARSGSDGFTRLSFANDQCLAFLGHENCTYRRSSIAQSARSAPV